MTSVHIVTLSLLLFPTLGLALGYMARNHPFIRRCINIPVFLMATIAIIAGLFGFSTTNTNVDFILYSSLYLSISIVMWYIFFRKSRIIAALLMFIVYACGYIFSLTLPLTGDIMPKVILRLDQHTIYKETNIPSTYNGKQVEIFKVYNNFFEKRILLKTYYDTAPAFVNDTLELKFDSIKRELYLSMPQEDLKHMYTFHKEFNLNWKDTLHLPKYQY